MNGIELLRQARGRWPNTVFVAVSGYADDLVSLYESDVFPITVIPKPFRAEQVRRALAMMPAGTGDADEGSARGGPEPKIESATPARIHVLVVDDDAYQRALLAELLRLQGVSVREAPDGSTALEAVDEEAFTHVFLDFRMPGLGGAEVARLIRLRDDRAVIVFLSAYPEDVVRARIRGVGPAPVLGKPFDPVDVLAALRLSLAPGEPLEPFGGKRSRAASASRRCPGRRPGGAGLRNARRSHRYDIEASGRRRGVLSLAACGPDPVINGEGAAGRRLKPGWLAPRVVGPSAPRSL